MTEYIYNVTKNSSLIQIPVVRSFFDIPPVVCMYYTTLPMTLPSIESISLPDEIQQMYKDGEIWTKHFSRVFHQLHNIQTFNEEDEFFIKNKEMITNMTEFFKIQTETFEELMKEEGIQSVREIYTVSHKIWLWLVNIPQIVYTLYVMPPQIFIDVSNYYDKTSGEIAIPESVINSIGDNINDYNEKMDKLQERMKNMENEVVKQTYVVTTEMKKEMEEMLNEITILLDIVIALSQFIDAENCDMIRMMYNKITEIDIEFTNKLQPIIQILKPVQTIKQENWFKPSKGKNEIFIMQELFQPFTL